MMTLERKVAFCLNIALALVVLVTKDIIPEPMPVIFGTTAVAIAFINLFKVKS